MKYPVVLIDLDDTLLDFQAASHDSLMSLCEGLGHPLSKEEQELFEEINSACWKELELGTMTREQLSATRFTRFFEKIGVDFDGLEANRLFREGLSRSAVLIDGALPLCRLLNEKAELYVVTNGFVDTQAQRIRASGLEGNFRGIFASQEIGFQKPDSRFFDAVFKVIGEDKRPGTVILGDSLSSDMKGGKNAGIATCWFEPTGLKEDTVGCDHRITKLSDFVSLVGADVSYRMAEKDDIESLCDMAMYFMREKYPQMTQEEEASIREQRVDFLKKNLGDCIFGFMGFVGSEAVCSALLHVIEQPANRWHPNGRTATVLNVFTWPDHRRKGYAEGLMHMLMDYAATLDLSYVDLQAAPQAKHLYEKLGFIVPPSKNTPMRCPMRPVDY
ncbi:MAG: YjjG family noncanonical pyrimidine nucleotidase [Clostridia bacterium]|nr:YjjG family noncanonical pyrimidine nucleotidase [Clostridia bacterium]